MACGLRKRYVGDSNLHVDSSIENERCMIAAHFEFDTAALLMDGWRRCEYEA